MTNVKWHVAGVTDRGLSRADNQDNYHISSDERLYVVADGMGGTKGGALASRIAVETIEILWKESRPDTSDYEAVATWLEQAVQKANQNVYDQAKSTEQGKRMGTTIVAAVQTQDDKIQVAHVGDSRVYLVNKDETKVITQDHSIVMEMMMRNQITPEQWWTSPYRNLLTRCLGHDPKVQVDLNSISMKSGDCVILCSDGLTTVLRDNEVKDAVASSETAKEICSTLLDKTLEGGAPDNVTIVIVQCQSESNSNSNESLSAEGEPATTA